MCTWPSIIDISDKEKAETLEKQVLALIALLNSYIITEDEVRAEAAEHLTTQISGPAPEPDPERVLASMGMREGDIRPGVPAGIEGEGEGDE